MAHKIDINCDMGESYGQFKVGKDQAIFPYITSCNIACGFHGGDPLHIENTIRQALKYNLQIGAHPSYPDLQGFGRRPMQLDASELKSIIKYQVAALQGMVNSLGGHLSYVKPHGALYNKMSKDNEEATIVIEAIREIDNALALMGLSGSHMEKVAQQKGIAFVKEAFADRRYNDQGELVSRSIDGAVIDNAEQSAKQMITIVKENQVATHSNKKIAMVANSICIHGDNPNALELLQAIHKASKTHAIEITKFIL